MGNRPAHYLKLDFVNGISFPALESWCWLRKLSLLTTPSHRRRLSRHRSHPAQPGRAGARTRESPPYRGPLRSRNSLRRINGFSLRSAPVQNASLCAGLSTGAVPNSYRRCVRCIEERQIPPEESKGCSARWCAGCCAGLVPAVTFYRRFSGAGGGAPVTQKSAIPFLPQVLMWCDPWWLWRCGGWRPARRISLEQ